MAKTSAQKFRDRVVQLARDGVISVAQADELAVLGDTVATKTGDIGAGARNQLDLALQSSKQRYQAEKDARKPPGGGDDDTVVTIDPVDGDGGDDNDEGTGTPIPVDNTPYAVRASAREFLQDLFKQFGFTEADTTALMSQVDGWIADGLADVGNEAILAKFRGSDIYANRFQGMAALRERGQAISEAEYIQMERSYRRVLSSYNLPTEFYDNYDDYAKFIVGDVSAQELEDRVVAARQILDNADSGVLGELQEYYGVDDGTAMSYLLGLTDEAGVARQAVRSQQELRSQVRAAQIGGAATRAGFNMGRSQSEMLAGSTLGQTLDPFNPQTQAQLEGTFNRARRTANRERTLAGIDQEEYTEMDTLEAAFGDDTKQLASERRGRRERARFSGTAGAARSALSQSRNL